MDAPGTPTLVVGFSLLCVVMGGLLVVAVGRAGRAVGEDPARLRTVVLRTAAGVLLLMLVTAALAHRGLLAFGTLPPPVMVLVTSTIALNLWLALTGFGERLARGLSWAALSGVQVFRIPVEIFLWQAYLQGFVPRHMTFEGLNWDILSGVGGGAVALVAARGEPPRWLLWAFNLAGLALLLNIVTIAILSMPTPLRVFTEEPTNTFVTTAPYVWLPVVLVQAALLSHVLSLRKLRMARKG